MRTAATPRRLPRPLAVLLAVVVFTSFLTAVKLIPSIRNNVGPFEIFGGLLILFFLTTVRSSDDLRLHATTRILIAMVVAAAVSQVNLPSTHRYFGLVQLVGLAFPVLLLIALHNLSHRYRISPELFLRLVTLSVLVIGPWILYEGTLGDPDLTGPFRNRAHMANYMLTAFWLSLAYLHWPGISTLQRRLAQIAMVMSIYGVAASGRRSVYLAFLVGLAALSVSFVLARRGRRFALLVSGVLAIGFVGLFYSYGGRILPQAAFFQERVGMIDDRLYAAINFDDDSGDAGSFFALQRQGVRMAFDHHPILGIGWGGFPRSIYSPTGHEVHSTPLLFLAELGLVGFALYLSFMIALLFAVGRLFARLRKTPLGGTCLTLALGVWSMSLSYIYNRHFTERTFWVLLAVILAIDALVRRRAATARAAATARLRTRAQAPAIAAARVRQALPGAGGV